MAPFTVNWGIISTGVISTVFAHDLLVDPASRNTKDVNHKITAVGSRSVQSAQAFIDKLKESSEGKSWAWGVKNGVLDGVKPRGTYEEVYNDPDVTAIYVGTPHVLHHRNAKDALLAGKHVLLEKPACLEVEELDELFMIAKEKNLFFMEAVWTRFQPITYAVEEVIKSGILGKPKRFSADFSMDWNLDADSGRMANPALGGGSLLDSSAYPSVWAMLLVHRHPLNTDKDPKVLFAHQTIYPRTGVDINSRWLVEWKGLCQGMLMTDLDNAGQKDSTAVLQCEEGDLVIAYPPNEPKTFYIHPRPSRFAGTITSSTTHHHPVHDGNNGMSYEADEVARCIRDGKIESERMPWEESRVVQGWVDKVRKEGPSETAKLVGTAGQ
ncbi:conserved hypothetical protein [Cryptococcus deneoformans JEC21]|uniref:D-xylose 1-dehydrogenase (NADP(+), D-xylono-1,5-lactone-forming) n=1 Tax=Cryptococcus deneoformans (strain JEC21 / ATCC MYA-565) TaxID=214684 RepID=Q5KFZ8_CRYD1|nr:conserved hypothetical protein [Cryptococcus neoformans var. neoformans JEC21]AAW43964.1 conserved hypothetical protein [Cryptococcus neoformans var. neoformans JEC21]